MNRIILIGNGFDLAHGLQTSYKHFIDQFWSKVIDNFVDVGMTDVDNDYFSIQNPRIFYNLPLKDYSSFKNFLEKNHSQIVFKNRMLNLISEKLTYEFWVDIERQYYENVKSISKHKTIMYSNIKDLNRDFNRIKVELSNYLEVVQNDYNFSTFQEENFVNLRKIIFSEFNFREYTDQVTNKFIDIFLSNIEIKKQKANNVLNNLPAEIQYLVKVFEKSGKWQYNKIRKYLLEEDSKNKIDLWPQNLLFVNFNYTNTSQYYNNEFDLGQGRIIKPEIIHIHGELNNPANPIIFGYGDELDESYKAIENLNNNDFLENVKSIKYLETSNYKKLLQFVNSDLYQVFIFGHSCGISDRTLLNTIFEHDNCGSIKVYYHQKKDGSDNYSDVVRNISRNFNDKVKMRDRVVNKEFSEPLVPTDVNK